MKVNGVEIPRSPEEIRRERTRKQGTSTAKYIHAIWRAIRDGRLSEQEYESWLKVAGRDEGKNGESFRTFARKHGLVSNDDNWSKLIKAWGRCTLEERQEFLYAITDNDEFNRTMDDEETKSALYLEHREIWEQRRRQKAFPYSPKDPPVPELETLISQGMTVSQIAESVGVSDRTVRRWRWGDTKPSKAKLSLLYRIQPGQDEK